MWLWKEFRIKGLNILTHKDKGWHRELFCSFHFKTVACSNVFFMKEYTCDSLYKRARKNVKFVKPFGLKRRVINFESETENLTCSNGHSLITFSSPNLHIWSKSMIKLCTIYSHWPSRLFNTTKPHEVKNKNRVGIFKNRLRETWLSSQVFVPFYISLVIVVKRSFS
jgi:hypothetical protein